MLFVIALLALATEGLSEAGIASDTSFAPGAEDEAVSRVVGGIISFARWPTEPAPLRLCVTGNARHAGGLGASGKVAGRSVSIRRIVSGAATEGCDVVYIGEMPADANRRVIASIRGRPVLSIAESDPGCRGGAMFCLAVRASSLSFQLSIDAISRGTVRIDPRVLRVASPGGGTA